MSFVFLEKKYFFHVNHMVLQLMFDDFFFKKFFFSHPLQLPVHFFGMLQDMFCNFLLKDIPFLYSVHVIAKDVSSLFSKVFHMFHMFYHLMIVELLNFFLSPCSLAMRFTMFYSFLYKIYVYWPYVNQTYR